MKFNGEITENYTQIIFEDGGQLFLANPDAGKIIAKNESGGVFLYLKENQPQALSLTSLAKETFTKEALEKMLYIVPPTEISANLLLQKLNHLWQTAGFKLTVISPVDFEGDTSQVEDFQEELLGILPIFGVLLTPKKRKAAKASHRWHKEVAEISFFVDYADAKGEAIWQKRNELRLKKGAQLKMTVPLNKDGSVGYGARFTSQLRQEHQKAIEGGVTVADIVFKSVNELGLFLYYGGANGWLVLQDAQGKTLDSYTVVK